MKGAFVKHAYRKDTILFMDSTALQLQVDGTLLRDKAVPIGLHPLNKKWLSFYLDFWLSAVLYG